MSIKWVENLLEFKEVLMTSNDEIFTNINNITT